ncbi:hypothetical protein [Streptomyces sp. ODS28]|uniref:hypothetical protein n=1 Tax=Streptomyces sp. ODS28 TaxID=3136688 RepID=UPI0031EEB7BF
MYTAAIAGLLFMAFAFFAVAQASTVRNGGQTAADSAALAAAQDDRDQLFDGFLGAVGDGDSWQDWLDGIGGFSADGCGRAEELAGKNRSDVLSCDPVTRDGHDGYTVEVRTRFDTGDTVVPGADHKKATATATAVVKPRCDFGDGAKAIEITCDGEDFTIDPDGKGDLGIGPSDLFSVVLVD